jgi:hypothetical protein
MINRRLAREVIETKFGAVDRLLSVAGKPLSEAQQRGEIKRILRLSHDADDQRKLEQSQRKDEQQSRAFLKMFPNAFRFEVANKTGDLVKVAFTPSSRFKPSSREGKILHEMAGEIWVNSKERRIARISGQLMNSVTFGGGILGHLEQGGHFSVERTEIAPEDWEVTKMDVSMQGKALLFKTISIKQKEISLIRCRLRGRTTSSRLRMLHPNLHPRALALETRLGRARGGKFRVGRVRVSAEPRSSRQFRPDLFGFWRRDEKGHDIAEARRLLSAIHRKLGNVKSANR